MSTLLPAVLTRNNPAAGAVHFHQTLAAGLVVLFGLQSFINMAVNLNLIPPKGMTLPFLSYGGSSMLSVAITTGFLLALTRKRPRAVDLGAFRR